MLDWGKGFETFEAIKELFRKCLKALYMLGGMYREIKVIYEKQRAEQAHHHNQQRQQYGDDLVATLRRFGFNPSQIEEFLRRWRQMSQQQTINSYSDLPNSQIELRRIIQQNHPDKNAKADLSLFQRAVAKLDALRAN